MPTIEELKKVRIEKLKTIQDAGVDPYPSSVERTHTCQGVLDDFEDGKEVAVAGRLRSVRGHGGSTFVNLEDETGKVQAYFKKDELGEEKYRFVVQSIDIGDFIEVRGNLFKTKREEKTILVKSCRILCKSLSPLPEKWHGISDVEERYRKRYLDLIMNPETKNRFKQRAQMISLIRQYLNDKNFTEVETPVLQPIYGGTNAKPFETFINAYQMKMYLRVAPELYLKRLLIGGFDKVYEIARNFRNEGVDNSHNPEFTMVEWYEAYAGYHEIMDGAENLFRYLAQQMFGKNEIEVGDRKVDLSKKWPKMTMYESIKKFIGIDAENSDQLIDVLKKNKVEVKGDLSKGRLVFLVFDKLVCKKLLDPVWIIDYPKEVSPLAKEHPNNPDLVERFEGYINGMEICDGWTEMNSPIKQRERFEKEQAALRAGDEEAHPMDADFIEALEYGMPPAGGIGIGIDRLAMIYTNALNLRSTLLFPLMKPKE